MRTQSQTLSFRLKQTILDAFETILLSEIGRVKDIQREPAGIFLSVPGQIAGAERDVSVDDIA